jgi:outer membrane protein OmpA-like peptidoglycan-associated protein
MGNLHHFKLPTQTNTIPKIITLLVLILIANFAYSQSDKMSNVRSSIAHQWEVGVFAGAGTIFGDIPADNLAAINAAKPALGLMLTRHLTQTLAVRGQLTYAKLNENRSFSTSAEIASFGYELQLLELSGALLFEPHAEKRRQEIGRFKKIISPYLFIGIGGNFGEAKTYYDNFAITPEISNDAIQKESTRVNLLLGGGIKYDLNPKLSVGLEVGIRPTFDDLLDGISHAGDPNKNDWFGFGGFTINYRIGQPDADGDGIADLDDKCPGAPGDKKFNGCPDSDGDGVKNSKDDCPDVVGFKSLNGCPDSDKDGTADHLDQCPNEKGMMRLNGCPDSDWDYVIDSKDECPNVPGKPEFNGCPPPTAAIKATKLALETTKTTTTAPETKVPTMTMQALTTPLSNNSEQEKIVAKDISVEAKTDELPVLASIQFLENSNQFDSEAYRILKEIAKVLQQSPNYTLHISSYAEVDKNGKVNQGIAGKRVFSCFKYLKQKGIAPEQLVYYNYKRTPDAAKDNGRVIFKLKK